jgi:prevent-host-death family protein
MKIVRANSDISLQVPTASEFSSLQTIWKRAPLKVLTGKDSVMLDISKDIQSLTAFRRKSGEFMKRLKKTKRPVVLTINGKAEAVVQDAESYQRLLDIAAQSDVFEAIRQGIDDIDHGRTRPAREVFLALRRKYGIRS